MESLLRRTGVYGLLFGLALAILFVDYKDVIQVDNGGYITTYKNVFEYIVTILRLGVLGMFLGLFIGWNFYGKRNKTQQRKSYYAEIFIAVFLVALILLFAINW